MKQFKKLISLLITALMCSLSTPANLMSANTILWRESLKTDFKKTTLKRSLSSTDISTLSTALSSTASTAGTDALALLSTIAQGQAHPLAAIFNICTALTTADPTHDNATPISLATADVLLALSTGIIRLLNDDYNYTLLHFATLFSTLGAVIDATCDTVTVATTIISTVLGGLSEGQVLSAVTAQDMWLSTPLHYAVLTPNTNQEDVVTTLLAGLTESTNVATAIGKKNTWNYTPLHIAATFCPDANNLVNAFFTITTTTQKLAALAILDQWNATPLDYAAAFKSTAFFNRAFWTGITMAQKTTALNTGGLKIAYGRFSSEDLDFFNQIYLGITSKYLLSLPASSRPSGYLTPKLDLETVVAPTLVQRQE